LATASAPAARPWSNTGSSQLSSASFHFCQGACPPIICTSKSSVGPPFFSASRGSGRSGARSQRPLSSPCQGVLSRRALIRTHTSAPRPNPAYLCFYCPVSVSLCNPQAFCLGRVAGPSFPVAVEVQTGRSARAVTVPSAAPDGACQRSPLGLGLEAGARCNASSAGPSQPPRSLTLPLPAPSLPRAQTRARTRTHTHTHRERVDRELEQDSETLLATH
jgi:hypothetical protein